MVKRTYTFKTWNNNPFNKGFQSNDGYRYAEIREKINKKLDRVYSVWMRNFETRKERIVEKKTKKDAEMVAINFVK